MSRRVAPDPPKGTPKPRYEAVCTSRLLGESVRVAAVDKADAINFAANALSQKFWLTRVVAILSDGRRVRIGAQR